MPYRFPIGMTVEMVIPFSKTGPKRKCHSFCPEQTDLEMRTLCAGYQSTASAPKPALLCLCTGVGPVGMSPCQVARCKALPMSACEGHGEALTAGGDPLPISFGLLFEYSILLISRWKAQGHPSQKSSQPAPHLYLPASFSTEFSTSKFFISYFFTPPQPSRQQVLSALTIFAPLVSSIALLSN